MTGPKKSTKSVSFVLSPTQLQRGHSLGVNALAYSKADNVLFSAGRDGVVFSWEPGADSEPIEYAADEYDNKLRGYSAIHDYASTYYDNESELIFLETQIRKGLNFYAPKYGDYKMKDNAQMHSDWINDIKILNDNKSVVTCSSDLSIKLWDSSSKGKVTTIGYHSDYVKCLAYDAKNPSQILSGSLDHSVAAWNLEKQAQAFATKDTENEKGSIYTIACMGNTVCSGGPENVVKLYDMRSNSMRPTKALAGHQSNVRALQLKNNYLLSGSADSTIKLWCLRTNRVLRTFDIHDSSVWCLECPEEENLTDDFFNIFYSGDKNGLIIKTDLQACNYDYYYSDNAIITGKLNENMGVSTVIADLSDALTSEDGDVPEQSYKGVLSLQFGENSLWSSSSSVISSSSSQEDNNGFVKRWAIPSTNKFVAYQSIKLARSLSAYNKDVSSTPLKHDPTDMSVTTVTSNPFEANNIVNDDLYDLVSQLSHTSNPDGQDNTITGKFDNGSHINVGEDEIFISPFLFTTGAVNDEFIVNDIMSDEDEETNLRDERVIIVNGQVSSSRIQTVPISVDALDTIEGQSGLIRHRLLDNRRQVATMDSTGVIEVWDLVKCKILERVETGDQISQGRDDSSEMLEYAFNQIIDKYQTNETLPMWCKVEIRAGKLFITLDEQTFGNTEIYLDQLIAQLPELEEKYLEKYSVEEWEEKKIGSRVNLGRMILKSVFQKFVELEVQLDEEERISRYGDKVPPASNGNELTPPKPVLNRGDSGMSNNNLSLQKSNQTSLAASTGAPLSKKTSNEDHSKKKFSLFGKSRSGSSSSAKEQPGPNGAGSSGTASANVSKASGEDSTSAVLKEIKEIYESSSTPRESALNMGDFDLPWLPISQEKQLIVIISEMVNRSRHEIFHGTLEDYLSIKTIRKFEHLLPRWCGRALLLNEFPPVNPTKINFVIEEYKPDLSAPSDLPPITKSSTKLNAVGVLRSFKIAAFVVERFDEIPPEVNDPAFKAHEFLEILCADQVIPFDMTLATVKARIWKKSSDVLLQYRRRKIVN